MRWTVARLVLLTSIALVQRLPGAQATLHERTMLTIVAGTHGQGPGYRITNEDRSIWASYTQLAVGVPLSGLPNILAVRMTHAVVERPTPHNSAATTRLRPCPPSPMATLTQPPDGAAHTTTPTCATSTTPFTGSGPKTCRLTSFGTQLNESESRKVTHTNPGHPR